MSNASDLTIELAHNTLNVLRMIRDNCPNEWDKILKTAYVNQAVLCTWDTCVKLEKLGEKV